MADGSPVWKDPEIAGIRALLAQVAPLPGMPAPTFEMRRSGMDALGEMGALPQGLKRENITVEGVPAELLMPAGAVQGRSLLYLHGGGYCIGSPKSHRPVAARLADQSSSVAVVPDYRLAPEAPFPAAVEDALKVYKHLLGAGHEPRHIAVAGDSAGGGLTLATMLAARDEGLPMPGCLFLISPWADLAVRGPSYEMMEALDPMITPSHLDELTAAYVGHADVNHPWISPARADLTGLPPMLIHVGQAEMLLSDSITLAQQAGLNGVEVRLEIWPEMIHVWHAFSGQLQAGRRALREAAEWIAGRLG